MCSRCGATRPLAEFSVDRRTRDGLQAWCKTCAGTYVRAWKRRNSQRTRRQVYGANLRRNYGLTLAEYEAMVEAQGGVCAVCGRFETARNRDGTLRRLHVDHDHASGAVRSLLCSACNHVVGYLESDPSRLRAVAEYLRQWGVLHADPSP